MVLVLDQYIDVYHPSSPLCVRASARTALCTSALFAPALRGRSAIRLSAVSLSLVLSGSEHYASPVPIRVLTKPSSILCRTTKHLGRWTHLEPLGPLRTSGNPFEITGNQWEPLETTGNHLEPTESHWNLLGIHWELTGNTLGTTGSLWKPLGPTRNHYWSTGNHLEPTGNPWDPLETTGAHWDRLPADWETTSQTNMRLQSISMWQVVCEVEEIIGAKPTWK